jgi:hypothetical protein
MKSEQPKEKIVKEPLLKQSPTVQNPKRVEKQVSKNEERLMRLQKR